MWHNYQKFTKTSRILRHKVCSAIFVPDCGISGTLAISFSSLAPSHRCLQFNTSRPRQNGRHFVEDILKCIFFNEKFWILNKISLKDVPSGLIYDMAAFVQIMGWHRRAPIHYLDQWWLVSWRKYASLDLNELRSLRTFDTKTPYRHQLQKHAFEWINVDGSEYAVVLIEVNFYVNGLKIALHVFPLNHCWHFFLPWSIK